MCGPKTSATSSACSKPSTIEASHCSDAGVASWVRKATASPLAHSIARLRVPPCENSDFGISITVAPWRRAMSSEPSVEPESTISELDWDLDALAADRAEDLLELGGAVQYRDRDRDGGDRHRPRNAPLTFFESQRITRSPKRSGEVRRQERECS